MSTYASNLSDSEWSKVSKYFDIKRIRKYDLKNIFNGIFYLVKTGCQWRQLPREFGPWKLVYYYFSKWKKQKLIEMIHEELVVEVRVKMSSQLLVLLMRNLLKTLWLALKVRALMQVKK